MKNEVISISPGQKREYMKLIKAAIDVENKAQRVSEIITLDQIRCYHKKCAQKNDVDEGVLLLMDCMIKLMEKQYEIIEGLNFGDKYSNNLLRFYKAIIYDFIDCRFAIENFVGLQLFNIERSIIEHSRMYITCLLDKEFEEYYFKNYTDDEKKERFYKKRGSNIDKKITEIYEAARNESNRTQKDTPHKFLLAINSDDLYKKIHDQFSEMAHLSEFTIARKVFDENQKLGFYEDKTCRYDKYIDGFLEYAVGTCVIVYLINNDKVKSESDCECCNIYNLLATIHREMQNHRQIDTILEALKESVMEIYHISGNE